MGRLSTFSLQQLPDDGQLEDDRFSGSGGCRDDEAGVRFEGIVKHGWLDQVEVWERVAKDLERLEYID